MHTVDAEHESLDGADTNEGVQAAPLDMLTLRFPSKAANQLFDEGEVVRNWAVIDRMYCMFGWISTVILITRMNDWTRMELLQVLATVPWLTMLGYLSTMRTPAIKKFYLKHRWAIVLVWRPIIVGNALLVHRKVATAPTDNFKDFFAFSVIKNSLLVDLALFSLCPPPPFWLHVITVPIMVLEVWAAGTVSYMSATLCSQFPREMREWHQHLRHLSGAFNPWSGGMFTGPGVLAQIHEESMLEVCPAACPADQVIWFLQITFGVVLPTVLLYHREWAARRRFAAAHVAQFPELQESSFDWMLNEYNSRWPSLLINAAPLFLSLSMLFQILDNHFC